MEPVWLAELFPEAVRAPVTDRLEKRQRSLMQVNLGSKRGPLMNLDRWATKGIITSFGIRNMSVKFGSCNF